MNDDFRIRGLEGNAASVLMPGEAIALIESAVAAFGSDQERARHWIAQLFALLRGAQLPKAPATSRAGAVLAQAGLAPWQLSRVTAHIDAHLADPIRGSDLAAVARLCTSHFFRAFKISTGQTAFSFIAQRRIARACELMATTDQPLCEIAIDCGLCDQSHFCRVFRRIVGITPNAWRRINQLGPGAGQITPPVDSQHVRLSPGGSTSACVLGTRPYQSDQWSDDWASA